MRWQDIRIHIVVISLLTGLAVFLGVQWLYNSLNFQKPLQEALSRQQLVEAYQIEDAGDMYKITITLRETGNLMETYNLIYSEVEQVMHQRTFEIQLVDKRNGRLKNIFNQGQFAIHEALVMGNFTKMAGVLNDYARKAGVESKVYIDDYNIYWQMRDGSYYLYDVVPRKASTGAAPVGVALDRR